MRSNGLFELTAKRQGRLRSRPLYSECPCPDRTHEGSLPGFALKERNRERRSEGITSSRRIDHRYVRRPTPETLVLGHEESPLTTQGHSHERHTFYESSSHWFDWLGAVYACGLARLECIHHKDIAQSQEIRSIVGPRGCIKHATCPSFPGHRERCLDCRERNFQLRENHILWTKL